MTFSRRIMMLKKQKKPKGSQNGDNNNVGVGEDKISNLPDELIHRILSFLPAKSCMSTCILSHRCKFIVYSIPILDFRNWRCNKNKTLETKLFKDFLDTLLLLHENTNIQKFYLDLDEKFDEAQVNRWISTAVKRKVKELCLRIGCKITPSIFPLSLFTCDSLTLLDLELLYPSKFIIPSTVCFPKLKILRLTYISFVDNASTRNLFSNLEELRLAYCSMYMSEGLCIVNPALKHLSITWCHLAASTLDISAPNLLTFSFTGGPPADFVLNSFPSLVEADVNMSRARIKYERRNKIFVKLFERLSSAKLLKISVGSLHY